MTTLKQGDLIKSNNGKTFKVLGVGEGIVHLSYSDKHNGYLASFTESELKEDGYTLDTPAWEPSIGRLYWFIDGQSDVFDSIWQDDIIDHARRDFLGIYQTKELAVAALLEIRRKLGK